MRHAEDTTLTRRARTAAAPAGQESGTLVLGRYRLGRRLGAGAFGVVWRARDERLGRDVAIKRIAVDSEAMARRAEREARAAARLQHPGIVALFESGRDDEAVHLVSELVLGRTLAALMRDGRLSDMDVLGIGIALCDALDHAHHRGVVHRDVKPGNVIVPDVPSEAGAIAKLTDFGVASVVGDEPLTATGDVVGTLAYMAPEQADGRTAGPAADLYALALVLFEALAGVNPVRGAGAAATARRVGMRLPSLARARRDLDPRLCAAIDRAVEPHPDDRGGVADLRDALAGALHTVGDEPGTIAAAPIERLARARPRRGPGLLARAAAGLTAGLLAAAVLDRVGEPPLVAAGVAIAVALLPRLGWLAASAAATITLALDGGSDAQALAAAALPVPLLLRRSGVLWSVPALAPLLATPGLAAAFCAVAGQPRRVWRRAALAALGAWWLALWEVRDPALAVQEPLLLAQLAVWIPAAIVLPLAVRGRSLAPDLAGAAAWATGLAVAGAAVADGLGAEVAGASPPAAVVAAALSVLLAARRAGAEPG